MHTFGELVVVDPRTLRPVVGVAQVTDAVTGDPVATFTATGDPAPVVSSSRGYVGQFQTPDGHPLVRLSFPSGDPVVVTALDQVAKAAGMVDVVERGRLSEASLSTTIGAETGTLVPPLVVLAMAADPTVAQAAAAAAMQAIADQGDIADPAIASALANPTSDTGSWARGHFARLPSTEVDIRDMPSWTGVGDQTAAFLEADATHPAFPVTVRLPAGTIEVQGAPLRQGLYYVGEGMETTVLTLPATVGAGHMFASAAHGPLWTGGMSDLTMRGNGTGWGQGVDDGVNGVDLESYDQIMGFFLSRVFVDGFDIGVRGSENGGVGDDRWLVLSSCLIWHNKIGLYGNEHPQVDGCDFRQNDIGLTGRLHDFNFVGKNKVIRNRVGLCPDPGSRGGMTSTMIEGAIFFRNSTAAILSSNSKVSGCLIEGGEWDPVTGSNIDGAATGLAVVGQFVQITNNFFNPATNVECAKSIDFQTTAAQETHGLIQGNFFRQTAAGKTAIYAAGTRDVSILVNYFWLTGGSIGIDMGIMQRTQIDGNKFHLAAQAQAATIDLFTYGRACDNYVHASDSAPWTAPMIDLGNNGDANAPFVVNDNQLVTTGGTSGVFISLDGRAAQVHRNVMPPTSSLHFKVAPSAGAKITGNSGYRTENISSGVIPDGASTLVVPHGLAFNPKSVVVTPYGNEFVWVSGRTATTFTISRAGTTGQLVVGWQAHCYDV